MVSQEKLRRFLHSLTNVPENAATGSRIDVHLGGCRSITPALVCA